MKNMSIRLMLIAGICGALYLPSVFAADTLGNQNSKDGVETVMPCIEISCQITRTDAAGKSELLAKPKVVAVEGETSTVTIEQDNGESIEIQLTGLLQQDHQPEQTKAKR